MKKWGKYIIAAVVVIFVGSNLFLLLKDDSKAARTVNISEWTKIEQGNVKKILHTRGVTEPENETNVYFDDQKGSLGTILVKEGDLVSNGTPLFSYDSQKLEERKADLEDEAARLQGEIDSVDQEISQLQQIDTSDSSDITNAESDNKKINLDVNVNVSSIVEGNVQQKIAEAEAEKGKLEAASSANEAKISRMEEQLADLNVVSSVDGQVVNINADLKDPMMTIASTNSVVKAVVPAKQVQEVMVGQKVKLYSKLTDKTYNGTVTKVITYPNNDAKKKKEPSYSFLVKLNEETANKTKVDKQAKDGQSDNLSEDGMKDGQTSEGKSNQTVDGQTEDMQTQGGQIEAVKKDKPLLVGTDMKMQVIVDEASGVPIISSKSMWKSDKKHYVYQLTSKGIVQRQEITLGVGYKGENQVAKGLQANDVIVKDKDAISLASASNFITPMKTFHFQKAELKSMSKKQYAKYILSGLFE
ncbi:efflux RND transporter periplasmic adaptor subunit [Rummeliibacillus pycnus]|uniref:efflux RND transporter periplasmic adaptor subunit n=1 Tax=Rummeliibacillus pycnus TaxID=101070 RepID=UPI003D2BBCBA